MPTTLSLLQLNYLKELVWWIEGDLMSNPFTVELTQFQTCFSRNRYGTFKTIWHNVLTDLEAYAQFGYITIINKDGQTWYELTEVGLKTGKQARKSE